MKKFVTRDRKTVKIKLLANDVELVSMLSNMIPRLSYEEILDGELDKQLGEKASEIEIDMTSSNDDIKDLLLSKAIFDAISKPRGL